jgi:dynein heavy chain
LWVTFDATIDIGLAFIREHGVEAIKTTDLQQVVALCNFLECFIDVDKGFKGTDEERKKLLDHLFSFAYAWGLGGSLDTRTKERFDTVVKDQFKAAQYPPAFTVFDYYFDLKRDKLFKPWTNRVQAFVYDKDQSFFDLMVPTTDTAKYSYCLEQLLLAEKPIFFTGGSGVGKSAVIANKLT